MKTKNIIIFGGLLVFGVIGYILLNKKAKASGVTTLNSQIGNFGKPVKETVSVNKDIIQTR